MPFRLQICYYVFTVAFVYATCYAVLGQAETTESHQSVEHRNNEILNQSNLIYINQNVSSLRRSNNRFISTEINSEIDVIEDKEAPMFSK